MHFTIWMTFYLFLNKIFSFLATDAASCIEHEVDRLAGLIDKLEGKVEYWKVESHPFTGMKLSNYCFEG